jgi:hypothetical protein
MLRRRRRLRNAPQDSVPSRCRRRDRGFGPALIDDRILSGPCGNNPAQQPQPRGCCLMAHSRPVQRRIPGSVDERRQAYKGPIWRKWGPWG